MFGLPTDVLKVIKEFSGPLMTRADWRTCKHQESFLIEEMCDIVWYYLQDVKEDWATDPAHPCYDEIEDWTLYGQKWLCDAHRDEIWGRIRPPRVPPRDGQYPDEYYKWYSHRMRWLNQ